MDNITPVLRGVARQATMMANDIKTYLNPLKRKTFGMEDWQKLSKQLDVLPLGLNRLELRVLQTLALRKDCSLTRLAATLQMTPVSVQRDLELFLQSRGLMEITTNGRNLTCQGFEYLKALNKAQR